MQNTSPRKRGRPRGDADRDALDAARFIESYLQRNKISKAKFARLHGMEGSTVSRALSNDPPRWTPCFKKIYCIAKNLEELQKSPERYDFEGLAVKYQAAPVWAKARVGELLSAIDGLLTGLEERS